MRIHRRKSDNEETSYWLSYSDMMAALLLVFVLFISFTMLQAKKQYEEKEEELINQQEIVEKAIIDAEEQQKLIEEQQEIMNSQQEQLDKIIGVRSQLIEALREEFSGTDMVVSVDPQTGAIILDSNILFDVDKYNIKPSGQEFLEKFLPRYIGVLLKPEFKDYVSEIIIEGHTDTNGTYMYNLELSQHRALSVSQFCLTEDRILSDSEVEELRKIITASGKSYSNPIYDVDGNVDLAASRRVEFKFRLKDEDMIEEMIKILNGED